MMRFTAGLAVATALAGAAAAQDRQQIGHWQISASQDPITDARSVQLFATNLSDHLILSCAAGGRWSAAYTPSRGRLAEEPFDGPLTYRVDDHPAVTATWAYTADAARLAGPDAAAMADGLSEGRSRLLLRVTAASGTQRFAEITITGAAEAFAVARRQCEAF